LSNVIDLLDRGGTSAAPVIVLVDLQEAALLQARGLASRLTETALGNCRLVLDRARAVGMPIAFVRRRRGNGFAFFNEPRLNEPRGWIEGFEPRRSDMIFERDRPSCYSSPEFAQVIRDGGCHFVLAGLAGESGCLSTLIEAFHRGHRAIYLWDASASCSIGRLAADDAHGIIAELMRGYARVMETQTWVAGVTRRLVGA
jgi:nicotinamidase-related amidase